MGNVLVSPGVDGADSRVSPVGMRKTISSLSGKVVGLLDSSKFNSDKLLDRIGDVLTEQYGVRELVRDRKGYFGRPVPEDQARNLAERCDLVITGVGD